MADTHTRTHIYREALWAWQLPTSLKVIKCAWDFCPIKLTKKEAWKITQKKKGRNCGKGENIKQKEKAKGKTKKKSLNTFCIFIMPATCALCLPHLWNGDIFVAYVTYTRWGQRYVWMDAMVYIYLIYICIYKARSDASSSSFQVDSAGADSYLYIELEH